MEIKFWIHIVRETRIEIWGSDSRHYKDNSLLEYDAM